MKFAATLTLRTAISTLLSSLRQWKMQSSGIERLIKQQETYHIKDSEKRVLARKSLQRRIQSDDLARELKTILLQKVRDRAKLTKSTLADFTILDATFCSKTNLASVDPSPSLSESPSPSLARTRVAVSAIDRLRLCFHSYWRIEVRVRLFVLELVWFCWRGYRRVDNGLMTPTLKVRRDRLAARYAEEIDKLFK
ncbi:hypothetical protein Droror1_Dr00017244 [Drosera rotundifolia]